MHELGIATGVFDNVKKVAFSNNCKNVTKIDLICGSSTDIIDGALNAAFEALKELDDNKIMRKAQINITKVESKSICLKCGCEFNHWTSKGKCPDCQSIETQVIAGRDIYIDKIEVEEN